MLEALITECRNQVEEEWFFLSELSRDMLVEMSVNAVLKQKMHECDLEINNLEVEFERKKGWAS